ncbi:conjugal transfer protein TrbF, partial [Salmonella enterica]|uniref:conjugal transfer protein TrbF n=1 Tax=Salmonella enterica TaxID=28901 RepID=UPI003FA78347
VRAVGEAVSSYQPTDAQIAHHLARFIGDMRGLSIEAVVVRQNWLEAYEYATDRGAATLNEYARANDPFARLGQQTVSVEVTSVVRASASSFQVRWIERSYANGAPFGMARWTAV